MRIPRLISAALALSATAFVIAACGSSSSDTSSSSSSTGASAPKPSGLANVKSAQGQQKGGTLNVVSAEGWQNLDPGQSYFQIDYLAVYATHRPLYSFKPEGGQAVPDLASGPAQISADGKTVKVKIKPKVKYSPPLNRAATSADGKYAIERTFNPNVANGYAAGYYPIVGSKNSKGGPISGIETPDETTIVFHLAKNFGATFAQSLTLPGSAPVPKEVAAKGDKKNP